MPIIALFQKRSRSNPKSSRSLKSKNFLLDLFYEKGLQKGFPPVW
jgi:hypothetical protein